LPLKWHRAAYKEFESRGLQLEKILADEKNIRLIADKFNVKNVEEIYKAIGFGRISPKQIANLFINKKIKRICWQNPPIQELHLLPLKV